VHRITYQHYALFRHMTIFEKLIFGSAVRPRRLPWSEKKQMEVNFKNWFKPSSDNERNLIVRLIEPLPRPAATPIEKLTVSALSREGAIPLQSLVERVTSELYVEELSNGAWILDIGLFGKNLFIQDAVQEIKAGAGTLWQIDKSTRSF
jgi:ABC-type sugar transport system ATPase subunit